VGKILFNNYYKKVLTGFLFFISTFIISISCDSTEPTDELKPGRRDYTWTIDTLYSGSIQTYMVSMWGSSSEDVWICGYDADNSKCIYHFNGTQWYIFTTPATNFIKKLYAVEGSNANNIFFVGKSFYLNPTPPPNFIDSAYVLQYSNGSWKNHTVNSASTLYSLCMVNESEVWAGGVKGNLFRYTGSDWQQYFLGNEELLINGLVAVNSNEVYATGHSEKNLQGGGNYLADYLYQYNGSVWSLIDSNITTSTYNRISYPTVMKNINGNIYGSRDDAIVKKNGNSWVVIKTGIYGQFDGTNEKNIFLANQDFGVLHFDGTDWFRFDELPWLRYYDIEVFDDAVFILATDGYKTFIVKGIIKKK